MPDGTIQDSRRPTSPQWGYLKVKNPNKLKGSDPNQNDDWNEYALFITKNDKTIEEVNKDFTGNNYKKNVTFELTSALITEVNKEPCNIKIMIAHVNE